MKKITSVTFVLTGLLFTACQQTIDPNEDPRFEGNRKMVHVLDSLNSIADPNTNYFLSGRKAAKMLQESHNYTNPVDIINWETKYCFELLNAGSVDESIKTLTAMINKYPGGGEAALSDPNFKKVFDLLAVAYLRMGENDNCIANHNSASCIVPLQPKAFHKNTKGSLTAIEFYTQILRKYPTDYQSKWLMNIAYMTLGKYPSEVPKEHYIDFAALDEKVTGFVPLENLAIELGVDVDGLAGAAIIEDFNNDGFMDIFCSSYGLFDNPNLFISDTKGGYTDETAKAMLTGLTGGLNAKQADFNNDGFVDILVLRGAWLDKGGEWPNSLLRNNGDGTFSDITFSAGMGNAYPTETAAWADVNNDGLLDVFIANENNDQNQFPCELYINKGNETFDNVAKDWGMDGNFGYAKAAVFADFNNDGWQDLYVACLNQDNKLFMNRGKQKNGKVKFENIAAKAGVTKPFRTFPALTFDYNNDGFEDIFCTSFPTEKLSVVGEEAAMEMLGKRSGTERAKLYRNNGNETFTDVSAEAGLDKMIFAMGLNFGDLDNDGWLDIYTGTGAFEFNSLVPNRVFKNMAGQRFAEITHGSGIGHLQKGHGIAFGDLDNDGDQDIYTTLGGAVEGDNAHNALFANPNHGNHWVTLMLEGKSVSKDAQGSRVFIHCKDGDKKQTFHLTVGSGGSFGASSLQVEAGLGHFNQIDHIEIWWAGNPKKQEIIKGIAIDKHVKIVEGSKVGVVIERQKTPLKGDKVGGGCCKK
ncbi:MAG: hypothetical protein RIT42_1141 [Bacteroidota bacterium]